MELTDILFILVKGLICVSIFAICACRFMRVKSSQARPAYARIVFLLGGFSFGMAFTNLMPHWMTHFCALGFMGATAALLIDDEKRWRTHTPDDVVKPEARWPFVERRVGERRGAPPQKSGAPQA